MTSISQQPVLLPQVPSNESQSVSPARSQSASLSGQPLGAAGSASGSAINLPKRQIPSGPAGRSDASPVNGRGAIPPAVPAVGVAPNNVNGAPQRSGPASLHNRKQSLTINATGASGFLPNGSPVTGKPPGGANIMFGSMEPNASPNAAKATPAMTIPDQPSSLGTPASQFIPPTASPEPIPQPPASGGRPPSSLQGQGNQLNFGSMGGEVSTLCQVLIAFADARCQQRSSGMSQGLSPAPNHPTHLRRDSSHSVQSDFNNPQTGYSQGRGGYPTAAGRGGRAYSGSYNNQMPYPQGPNNRYNSQSRATHNMTPSYSHQGRSNLAPYPNSPHQANPSPRMANAQPVHQQHGHMMPQMYPQGFYPGQMVPQVNPHSPKHSTRGRGPPKGSMAQIPFPSAVRRDNPIDLAPSSGNFERMLTNLKQGAQYGAYNDPNFAYYSQYPGAMPAMPQQMYMPSSSPRPGQPSQAGQPYYPSQYAPQQSHPMSRNSSAISTSASDRPVSSAGRNQTPAPVTATVPQAARAPPAPSPVPSTTFQRPAKRASAAIVIKDPNTLAVKSFDKSSTTEGRSSQSPAKAAASIPTPPPRTASSSSGQHARTESKTTKTAEEKRNEFRDSIAKNLEAEKADQQIVKEDDTVENAERDAEAAALLKEKADIEAKEKEAAAEQMKAELAANEAKAEAETASKAVLAATQKAEDEEARKKREEDEEFARIEKEMEEMERQEAEREAVYQAKKQVEKEEKARKEAEAAAQAEADMKRLEAEAEEREATRLKKLEDTEGDELGKERQDLFAALKKEAPGTPGSDGASPAVETPEESGIATPASENSMPPPAKVSAAQKHKPAGLVIATSTKTVEPDQPSAALKSLLSARKLTSLDDVQYPTAIASPNPALNSAAPPGHFRYDRNFLMQFQKAYKEAPSEGWASKVKSTVGDTSTEPASARSASGRGAPMGMGSRQPSLAGRQQTMGQFGAGAPSGTRTLPPGTTSQARFAASNNAMSMGRGTMSNPLSGIVQPRPGGGFPMPMAGGMARQPSGTGMQPQSPRGNPSQRGNASRSGRTGKRENEKDNKQMPLTAGANLKPIEVSASGWKPTSIGRGVAGMAGPTPGGDGLMPPDVVQKKVKSQLNKMTPSNFEKISTQILEIVGQSKHESDGRTLRQVIQLTFEKATDEAHWAEMYANFCKRMQENMSPEIKDENITKEGKPVVGGGLFRKYLLTRCQAEFERGWKGNLPEENSAEAKLMSDEYYIAAAAKRRGLGLVRFIGELYKLGMLTERIMHECVKKLVDYEGMPDEAEVESLTSLLRTIGYNLDHAVDERSKPLMDVYFQRINIMIGLEGLPSRLRFMLMVSSLENHVPRA